MNVFREMKIKTIADAYDITDEGKRILKVFC